MFLGNKKGIVSLALAGCLIFTTEFEAFAANPQSEAQALETMNHEISIAPLATTWEEIPEMASVAVDTQEWYGKALANTEKEMNVYDGTGKKVIGKMYKNTVVTVVSEGKVWAKVSSGNVVGYVKKDALLYGTDAVERAEKVCAKGTKNAQTLKEIETAKKKAAEEAARKQHASSKKLLAAIIFCEAGNQSYTGKVAVGSVVMNRVASGRFPNSIQSVVYQRGQFTPAMTGKLDRVLASGNIPASCYQAAEDALNGAKPVGNALFFNTGSGNIKLGDHYFS